MLAQKLGVNLYNIGEANAGDTEPSRHTRLQELKLAHSLLTNDKRALLLFDDMEGLLERSSTDFEPSSHRSSHESQNVPLRKEIPRLLEQTRVPALWTMNDTHRLPPAILRSMMFALELRPPTTIVKAAVWKRQLDRHGVTASNTEVQQLAIEFDATPDIGAGATTAALLTDGGIDSVRRGARSLSKLLGCEKPPQPTPDRFDLALIHADIDLTSLADRIVSTRQQRFSICLHGPPGTGKSAYVRYLAERMGLEIMQKRA